MVKTKIIEVRENKHLTEKLEEDEIIFALTVADVQYFAEQKLGRTLDYYEVHSVKKGVEWGLDYWDEVIKVAIDNLPSHEENDDIIENEKE